MATPAEVEARLIALSKEYDGAYSDLADADQAYLVKKAQLEIAMARSRMTYAGMSSPTGKNYTVGERDDKSLLDNAEAHTEMAYAEASVSELICGPGSRLFRGCFKGCRTVRHRAS